MSRCANCYRGKLNVCDWIEPPEKCDDYRPYWVQHLVNKPMQLMLPGIPELINGRITGAADDFFIFHSNGRDYIVDYVCDYTLRKV